jgi:hypothetical protein
MSCSNCFCCYFVVIAIADSMAFRDEALLVILNSAWIPLAEALSGRLDEMARSYFSQQQLQQHQIYTKAANVVNDVLTASLKLIVRCLQFDFLGLNPEESRFCFISAVVFLLLIKNIKGQRRGNHEKQLK